MTSVMRPFFSYYGAKWTSAKHYGSPRRDLVIEPFAGSACYSTRWGAENVRLYDISNDICDLWDFLIHCSDDDIRSIPDMLRSNDDLHSLPRTSQLLCGFWIAKGRASASKTLSPWYHEYSGSGDCRVWGPAVKARILSQKPRIRSWTIDCLSWERVPLDDAHWHVDPPYNNAAGSCYPNSTIDYSRLADWCRSLPGTVDVCENAGANWLPFTPSHSIVSSRGRRDGGRSMESVWSSDGPFLSTHPQQGTGNPMRSPTLPHKAPQAQGGGV